ncbi:hypothetical protein [Bianquea renquensis]|uniref:Uncharacterized protein n=1 Tax=Bianquea renquensis TaxID=2763661 RepID=A0A926DS79_9FIRM|nr:hypothetical protein [Bianquea renquensis]MBC8543058.1 hypothetical protein [Bianquea renquensis]
MSVPVRKMEQSPESYAPKSRPVIISMAEELCTEKILDTIVIEGVEFTIIEKAKTLYAGSYFVAPDLNSEPDVEASCQWFQDNRGQIVDSVTPDRMICISIDYATPERPCAILHGQETRNANQPKGIHVIEAEPTLLIKVRSTDEAWALTKKITGEENPQWHMAPLFGLIRRIFCEDGPYHYNYEFNGGNGKGNDEMEYYCYSGESYVTVPVKKKG